VSPGEFLQLVPATGLVVECTYGHGSTKVVRPIVALGLDAAGGIEPLVIDGDGDVHSAARGASWMLVRPQLPGDQLS